MKERRVEETRTTGREVLSPDDLAAYLGCGRTHAYKLLADGSIKSFKIGRLRRVLRSDVSRYFEKQKNVTAKG